MAHVHYAQLNAIAEITLDNPPVNALTEAIVADLISALDRAAADRSVRAVILHSALARRFCAGLDLAVLERATPQEIRSLLDKLYPGICEAQLRLGKPSIAAVTGAARGGGMTLAISCDLIAAGRSASFGYPEVEIGVLPAIHFAHLHRIVGRYRAFELLFTGRSFDAEEAHAMGLINRVVDDDRVLEEARSLAKTLAGKAPAAMHTGRAAFYRSIDHGYQQAVRDAVETFSTVATSAEGREGISAFVNKRPPDWREE
jgi:enoyl-CoA hydratase/carnithine racemase